ncbi:MAG: MucB/RseB C-terminal domain-containing protein [Gammaproteobacteria bacterium]|nr:MucB/RseB C-terminal domain-containing protein [Gammaproteobacteria bacterium]
MAEATRALHYTGTFVYHRGNQIHSLKIVHRGEVNDAEGSGEYERMTSLTGAAREVIRDGSRVVCIYADNRSVVVEKSPSTKYFPLALIGASSGIGEYYQIEVKGDDRVAGRATWNVAVRPTADDRYGYAIWIDKESKLPMRSTVVDANGRILEEIQFTSLTTHDAIPDAWLEPEFGSAGYRWFANTKPEAEAGADDAAGDTVDSDWNVSWLPAGFKMLEDHEQMVSASRVPVRHWVFSDGLAMVSVFIEQLDDVKKPLRGFSTRGAVNALGRVERKHQITVVGEVPLDTVRRIAGAVEYRDTQ